MKHSLRTGATDPQIAVIGGGIFGVTAALVLSERYAVTLFEKNNRLLAEATFANQYRHHYGFHYPRSSATILEIQKSRVAFEHIYGSVLFRVPSYYAVSRTNSLVSSGDYLAVFRRYGVPFEENKYPSAALLNRSLVSACIKTPEAVYDYGKLLSFVQSRIVANPRITLRMQSPIRGARIGASGNKILQGQDKGGSDFQEEFDVVINATYARYNTFCRWLNFPEKALKFRLKELVLFECAMAEKAAVTVMDGPFATMLPTGSGNNLYTLGDVPLSVHGSRTDTPHASVNDAHWGKISSRHREIQERCAQWFPCIKEAVYRESRFVILPTELKAEQDDARETDLTYHGSGCWSILGGKIVTCVSVAAEIRDKIERQQW